MSEMKYRRGLVPLSADPITGGHLDLIRRARAECRELIVAILNNDAKSDYLFSIQERTEMAERGIREAGIDGVRVVADAGLSTDLYMREDCDQLFRGVRDAKDKIYEEALAREFASIYPPIEGRFTYLQSDPKLDKVSSSRVKAFVRLHLDVSDVVPAFVKRMLEERLLGQFKIAVTGGIAVGKSSVAENLKLRYMALTGRLAHHIDVDQLLRGLYEDPTAGAQALREEIAKRFGDDVLAPDRRTVNRAALAERLFSPGCDPRLRLDMQTLTQHHVDRKLREALAGKKGLIVLEWAQLAEMGLSRWANHRAIVVDSSDRERFAEIRGIPADRLAEVRKTQWPADKKVERLQAAVDLAQDGRVLRYDNRMRPTPAKRDADIDGLVGEVAGLFPNLNAS